MAGGVLIAAGVAVLLMAFACEYIDSRVRQRQKHNQIDQYVCQRNDFKDGFIRES